ncbi:hypothetical protein [Endozoicomonas sp. ONNA2]|uniref:hypothetical protein n=1 Tax=Endozoicomonas sp. ONNA2 TaxID=2828741 RepID=UPI0021494868|nr:hypothetical protein [Endozoicomonas sp. ONNA2]
MNFNRVSGGHISGYGRRYTNPVKGQRSLKYNHHKVGRTACNNHLRRTHPEYCKTNKKTNLKQITTLEYTSDNSIRTDKKKIQPNPDKLPKLFSEVTSRGTKAKSAEEARDSINKYFQLLSRFYSREAPPSIKIRERLYNDVVKLSARVMSFEFIAGRDKDKEKTLGLTAELLQQMLYGLSTSTAEFVNSQVTAVLSLGMMTPEDKAFLFNSCLNTQIISVDKYTADILNLDTKIANLSNKLTDAKQGDAENIRCRIRSAGFEREDLMREYEQLMSEQKDGMHTQKEFFQSCYKIMINQVKSEVRESFKKQLKKKIKKNLDEGLKLINRIMEKMDSTLRSKAESIAKNEANRKKGVQAEDVYQQKKLDLFLVLNDEILGLVREDEKGVRDLKSTHVYKHDKLKRACHIVDEAKVVDLKSENLDINDVFLPMNKQAGEWSKILLQQLPDLMRESIDVKDLTKCLDEKALEMNIRDDLFLLEDLEDTGHLFDRKSVPRKSGSRRRESKIYNPMTSVTKILRDAVVRQGQNIKTFVTAQSEPADIKRQSAVRGLIKFFEETIEQHKMGIGYTDTAL